MSYDMKAKCRIDVEGLGTGLKNELKLETDNNLDGFVFSLPDVYALKVGRLIGQFKSSCFKFDKENDNTVLLDRILDDGNYVEIPTTTFDEEFGTFEYGADIYAPYDVINHPGKSEDVLLDYCSESKSDKSLYFEATFYVEGYIKKMYFHRNRIGVKRVGEFIELLADLIDDASVKGLAGIKLLTDGWLEVEFYNAAGVSNSLSFEDSIDLFKQLSSVRIVRFNPKESK